MNLLRPSNLLFGATVLLALLGARLVSADGDIGRPATTLEKSTHARVMSTFAAALPSGPPGWPLQWRSEVKELEIVAENCGQAPMMFGYGATWQDEAKVQAAEEAEIAAALKARSAAAGAEEQRLMDRTQQLLAELARAEQQGDVNRMMEIGQNLAALSNAQEQIHAPSEEHLNRLKEQRSPRDAILSLSLHANWPEEHLDEKARREAPLGGALVLRTDGGIDEHNHAWFEGTTWVFLGPNWQMARDGELGQVLANLDQSLPHTAVQNVVVKASGDPERVRRYLEQMDWTALNGLIKP